MAAFEPLTGRIGGGGRRSRLDEHEAETSPMPSPAQPSPAAPRAVRWGLFVGVGLGLAVVAGGAGWAIGSGSDDDERRAVKPAGIATTVAGTASATESALDPALVDGYVMFSRIVTAEVAPGLPEPLIPRPGDTGFSELLIACTDGSCVLDGSDLQFAAAAPTITAEFTMEGQPGDQWAFTRTFALDALRADNGRYSGTLTSEILPLFIQGPEGPCWGQRTTEELLLLPISD